MLLTRSARDNQSSRWHLLYPALAGGMLAYATLTRTVGLPICALGFVYLLTSVAAYWYLRRTFNARLERGVPVAEAAPPAEEPPPSTS